MWKLLAVLCLLGLLPTVIIAQDESCIEFWQSTIDKLKEDPSQFEYVQLEHLESQLEACNETSATITPFPEPTATPRLTATPSPRDIIAEGTIVGDINVNVRTCASTSCEAVTSISPGETVYILSESEGWYEVLLEPDGNIFYIATFLIKPDYCAYNIGISEDSRGSFRLPHKFCSFALVDGDLLMAVTGFEYIEGNVWRGRWYYSPATGYQFLRVKISYWCDQLSQDVCNIGNGYKYSVVGDGWTADYEHNVNDYQEFGSLSPGGGGYIEMIFHVKQDDQSLMVRYDPIAYGYDVQFFSVFPEEML